LWCESNNGLYLGTVICIGLALISSQKDIVQSLRMWNYDMLRNWILVSPMYLNSVQVPLDDEKY
jgi:hypothetical protein